MNDCRILITDDELHLIHILKLKLEQAGYEVETASNGEEALALVGEFDPHLIVSDFQMPIMDGYEFCTRLRANEATADIPVIMLTARGHKISPTELLKTNIQRMMQKPFSAKELVMTVEEVLRDNVADAA